MHFEECEDAKTHMEICKCHGHTNHKLEWSTEDGTTTVELKKQAMTQEHDVIEYFV